MTNSRRRVSKPRSAPRPAEPYDLQLPSGRGDATRLLPVVLHRTREALAGHFRPVFLRHDLTDPQWRVLRILRVVDEIDTAELARRSFLLGPSLSRILRDLLARGLIARRVAEDDARRSFHSLTPAGRRLIEAVAPEFDPLYAEIESRLGVERIKRLNGLLIRLLTVLQPEMAEDIGDGG